MIRVDIDNGKPATVWISEAGSDIEVAEHEIDQLISDLQQAAVRLKANQLTEGYATPKSPTEKLEEEIEQLKERVSMLEHANMRKL